MSIDTLTRTIPSLWEECANEGVIIIAGLPSVKDAAVKVKRGKFVDSSALGRKIIDDHFNGHLKFRGIILRMVSNGSKKEEQRQAAIFLAERFLATL